jgi:hypothetical protein
LGKSKLIAGLASAIVLAAAGPAAANVLPVGAWDFNEGSGAVAHDTSLINHDNGAVQGGAQWTHGRFWDALSFDGNAAAVDVPSANALQPAKVTVSAWVNDSSSPGDFKYIVGKGSNDCSAASYALYTGANGGLEFYTSTNNGLTYTLSPDAGTGIWDGKWHSVIGTFDGSTVSLYVDGKEIGSGTPDTSPIAYGLPSTSDLVIGNYPSCAGLGFNGAIDAVKVFDRALPAQEIRLAVATSKLLPTSFPIDAVL